MRVALLFSLTYQVVQHPTLYVGIHLSQLSMWDYTELPPLAFVQPTTWVACHMGSHTWALRFLGISKI
jgi:hypothetical protein